MNKGQLMKLLEKEMNLYLKDVEASLIRNTHMHNYQSSKDLTSKEHKLIDAVLVGFLNSVATGQGLDLGLYTRDIERD